MKIVALFDTHIPDHIRLTPIFGFIRDFHPDLVVLGGDLHNFDPASHWIALQSMELDGKSLMKCYGELHRVLLKPLQDCVRRGTKIIYLTGNHEDWVRQTVNLNRNGQGYWELENNIPKNITILPLNIPYRVNDNLAYTHGATAKTEYHAKKIVQDYHCSVFYGHTHDSQSYTSVSPLDVDKFYKAMSCGCLCNKNPSYAKNRPNRWVHGFHYCYVRKDETFHDVFVTIVNGGFYAEGRYYK